MDSNPVQMTECWADTKQKRTSHASWTIFRCCGADNASDWMKREDVSIPASCCARHAPNCTVVQKTALISTTAGPGLGTASDLPATLNLSIYNEGFDVTIRSYAYTSAVIICVNTFMLTLVWIAWIMRQRHTRVNSNLVFARHSRVSHKRRSSNNSALHDTGSGNERPKTSGKASTKVGESSLDKNVRLLVSITS
ncbi:unnamed protein product [Clavelina lepadiformis]|uniref:Uncharacterized protein n=1 Tax=Clavelina lepadiformis TaxID=159417 RepID=A0ABP0GTI3_CLALP